MDELRLRQIFLGLVNCSLLLAVGGCGGATEADPGTKDEQLGGSNGGARAGGAGGAPTVVGGGAGGSAAGSGGAPAVNGGSGGGEISAGGSSGTSPVSEGEVDPFWPDLPQAEFQAPPCTDGNWRATQGLNPASPADFVTLRVSYGDNHIVLDANGTPCASATDTAACDQALEASAENIPMSQSCGGPPFGCQHYLLSTAADEVHTWVSHAELLQFLGPIDTPNEALLTAFQGTFMGYNVSCGAPTLSSVRQVADGFEVVLMRMTNDCAPIRTERALLHVATNGTVTPLRSNVASISQACVGRRPEGLQQAAHVAGTLGEFFAGIAQLEAASVEAFLRLGKELEALGAPEALRLLALQAAGDEVRHACETARVAERFGGRVSAPVVASLELRNLERVAAENIAEGCVRETFGALVAQHQAQSAQDPAIAALMRTIAADETRHAALAWRVASWADSHLSQDQRERVRAARQRALFELRRELEAPVPDELCRTAGIPEAKVALELFDGLARELWQVKLPPQPLAPGPHLPS